MYVEGGLYARIGLTELNKPSSKESSENLTHRAGQVSSNKIQIPQVVIGEAAKVQPYSIVTP
jgi:hypothetical protein